MSDYTKPSFDPAETTINRLGALQTLGDILNRHLDLATLLESVIEIVFSELRADNGSIMLLDESKDSLYVASSRGLTEIGKKAKVRVGEGIAGRVATSAKPLLIQGTASQGTERSDGSHPHSSLCVPLLFHNQVRGVISANLMHSDRTFSYKDLQMLQIMASQTAIAIDNVTLMEGLRANNYAIVRSLAEAVEAKDPYTAGHCDFVSRYAVVIAEAMGLPQREIEEIKIGAILHDVGKIGISEEILGKEGKLTKEEFEVMKKHPIQSARIVDPLHLPPNCLHVIKYHHERPDGKGYPYSLKGDEIYIGARIVMVADTFDAMTSNRPYRMGLPIEVALTELRRCTGTQFDPVVVDAFIRILPQMISEGILRPHLCHPQKLSETQEADSSSPVRDHSSIDEDSAEIPA